MNYSIQWSAGSEKREIDSGWINELMGYIRIFPGISYPLLMKARKRNVLVFSGWIILPVASPLDLDARYL